MHKSTGDEIKLKRQAFPFTVRPGTGTGRGLRVLLSGFSGGAQSRDWDMTGVFLWDRDGTGATILSRVTL